MKVSKLAINKKVGQQKKRKNIHESVPIKIHYPPKSHSFHYRNVYLPQNYFIIAGTFGLLSRRQLEAMRRFLSRRLYKKIKKRHQVHLLGSIFKKSTKSRMGKGSGKFF